MDRLRMLSVALLVAACPAIAPAGLISNSRFDTDVSGWTGSLVWQSVDARGSSSSGSAWATNAAAGAGGYPLVGRTCVPILPGTAAVLSATVYVEPSSYGPSAGIYLGFYGSADCSSSFMGSPPGASTTTTGAWTTITSTSIRYPGARSVQVNLFVGKTAVSGSTAAYFDDVTLSSSPMDFDMSGTSDVLWHNNALGFTSMWLMGGIEIVGHVALPTVSDPNWQPVGLGDFQGDGKTDVLWRNQVTGDNVIWFMNGSNPPVTAILMNVPAAWHVAGVGDFQNDGKADILWRNNSTGATVVWLMDGPNIAASGMLPTVVGSAWDVVGLGDFQGDWKTDVLWHNSLTGDNAIWFMDGLNVAMGVPLPALPSTQWQVAAVADFADDGKADILWRNSATGENLVWVMDGGSIKYGAMLPAVVDPNWTVAGTGDLPGLGKSGILWRNTSSGETVVWMFQPNGPYAIGFLPTVDPAFQIVREK